MINKIELNKKFWEERFINNDTPWDIGSPSTPIAEYLDQIQNKEIKILIPGAGNAYEAEYAFKTGFKNVYVLDITESAINNFKTRFPEFPAENCILQDFFEHDEKYDLIIEQTFFCALDPVLRNKYVVKMHQLLNKDGHLAGVLFNGNLNNDRPPFGGSTKEYKELFEKLFDLKIMKECYNSIKPRNGRELFINFLPK